MTPRAGARTLVVIASLLATPSWADRGHGYGWGPFEVLLGSAILYSAIQPRPVYYGPPVQYGYGGPLLGPVVQPATVETLYPGAAVVPVPPSAPYVVQSTAVTSAGAWWYFCRKTSGYYPYVRECPDGWEKVSPTPPGIIKH